MKPAVSLKLNGHPLVLGPKCPSADRLKAWLDKQPADELFSSDEVAKRSGIALSGVRGRFGAAVEFADYSYLTGKLRYWGNPKAIAALRKQIEAQQ